MAGDGDRLEPVALAESGIVTPRHHAIVRDTLLVAGQGPFEVHPTQSLPGAQRMAGILAERGIPHELDIWGHDSAHDWPWWRKQLAHHLPRFV